VTVIPSSPKDFLDYGALLDDIFCDLVGKVKLNQIFSCSMMDSNNKVYMDLRESNLIEHTTTSHLMTKKGHIFHNSAELNEHSSKLLLPIIGIKPLQNGRVV
jgi:hypothetical protein